MTPGVRWKVVAESWPGGRKTYALARYEPAAGGWFRREPEHQDWHMRSDSLQELAARAAAAGIDDAVFGTRHFNNFAPQAFDPEETEMMSFREWMAYYCGGEEAG